VEDDAATRAAVVGSLELLGYQILEATNGQEALSIYKQHTDQADHPGRIALVLSDLVMPEMGGQVLFYALKRQKSDVKVLLLTGHPLEEEGLEALRAQGLKGWLPKPPSLERLAKVVAQVLEEE
jgi:CheY-like chemotaxis protein